jgi:hypothetical protein
MPLVSARVVSLIQPGTSQAFANAGEDQSVLCASIIQLQGEILGDDPALHTFEWEQTSGTPVTLINANTLFPTFVNPNLSDIEFTLYVDRGTPFETFDTVFISRRPASTVKGGMYPGTTPGRTSVPINATNAVVQGVYGSSTLNSVSKQSDVDFRTAAYSYNYPPDHTYSPIYKAEDLRRIENNLGGKYWLMRDVDMSDLETAWEPLGTPRRPFSGELQGNGFSIENLTITETPIDIPNNDPEYDTNTLLVLNLHAEATGDNYNDGSTYDHTVTGGADWEIVADTTGKWGPNTAQSTDLTSNQGLDVTGGTGDGLTLSQRWTLDINTSWCLEYWVQKTGTSFGSNADFMLFDQWAGEWNLAMRGDGVDGWYVSYYADSVLLGGGTRDIGAPFTTGVWHHLTIIFDSTTDVLYTFVDGSVVDSVSAAGRTPDPPSQVKFGGQGGWQTCNMGTQWRVDSIRFTKNTTRYSTSGFAVPTTAFSSGDEYKPAGLFSHIGNGALIEKVGVTNANISGVLDIEYKGILAGSAQGPTTGDGGAVTIRDCYVSGTVDSGGSNAGGLIGHTGTNVSSTFENTLADVYVTEANTDPLYPQVQFLASFDGTDLQQTYTEQSQNALAGTFQTGSSRIRTTEFYSSPSSYNNNSGTARLEFPNDAALQLGSGDFTIEFFLNFAAFSNPGTNFVAGHYGTSGNRPWSVLVTNASNFILRLNGATVATFAPTNITLTTDTWYHVVIERSGEDWHFGLSGYREQSGIGGLVGAMQTSDDVLTWGGNFNSGAISFLNGYIDDARITIGSARYDLASNETYQIPETPFATSNVSASVAGWAGNFQTEGVYNDNYWNTSKIDQGTGTGGDTPIAGEVDGLSGSALKTQSNYTNWDFDAIWQMPDLKDNIGPAQLQNDIFDRVANEGTQLIAGQQQGATWNRQALSGYRPFKTAEMRGVIIQDQNPATTAWENTRFIPVEQDSAIMAPGRRHRLFTVFGIGAEMRQGIPGGPKLREVTYLEPSTIVPKTTTDSNVFAGATSPVSAIYPGNMVGDTITSITITNPSKITKLVEDTVLSPFASQEPGTIIPSITRNIGAVFTQEDTILFAMSPGGGSVGNTTASITRNNGASIGT